MGIFTYIMPAGANNTYELAKCFAADGYNLVLVARTEQDVQQCSTALSSEYGISVKTITRDLFNPEVPFEVYAEAPCGIRIYTGCELCNSHSSKKVTNEKL